MKKADIKLGEEYFVAQGRSYLYGTRRVRVVNTELHVARRLNDVPRSELAKDADYLAAHLAWALTEAYPDDTTPKEREQACDGLREATAEAQRAWFDADPLRGYIPGKYGSSWFPAGVLVEYLNQKTGVAEGYGVEPRARFRCTWVEHVAAVHAQQQREAKAAVIRANKEAKDAQDRRELRANLEALGVESVHVSEYSDKVSLNFEQLLDIIERAVKVGKGEEVTA